MKMKMKVKNRSHIFVINKPWSRREHKISKYKSASLSWCLYVAKNTEATFKAQKKLSNTEAELKKSLAYKKTYITLDQTTVIIEFIMETQRTLLNLRFFHKYLPSQQILVSRMPRGGRPPTSPGRPLRSYSTVPGTSWSDFQETS